ncbi:hypothetical protein Leryth_002721 [Lithospermum erythrorhizon]|nr:hypothetical protein Leryth_002721 [Lithospermum erythrorhizon]
MARMFREDQLAARTRRVVGTYGKRISHFHRQENDFSLVGHAWDLWLNGKASELIDPLIEGSIPELTSNRFVRPLVCAATA